MKGLTWCWFWLWWGNTWMKGMKSLSSCVLAHGVCSSCLSSPLKLNLCNKAFAEQRFYLIIFSRMKHFPSEGLPPNPSSHNRKGDRKYRNRNYWSPSCCRPKFRVLLLVRTFIGEETVKMQQFKYWLVWVSNRKSHIPWWYISFKNMIQWKEELTCNE